MSSAQPSTTPTAKGAIDTGALTIVVMGVSGCGKSTIAQGIAQRIGAHGKDGDELHPPANIDKMAAGIPLTDEDRQPWLEQVAAYAREKAKAHGVCVIACSALKHQYRSTLNTAGHVVYIYLHGSHDLIASRMHRRTGHFMPEALLKSQFEALEDPQNEAHVLTVNIEPAPDIVVEHAIALLHQHRYLPSDPSTADIT